MPRKALRVVSPASKDTRHKVWRCPGDWDGGRAGRAETSNCVWGPIRVPPRSGQNKQAGETGARLSPAQMTQGGRLRPETAQAVVGFGLTKLLQQGLSSGTAVWGTVNETELPSRSGSGPPALLYP